MKNRRRARTKRPPAPEPITPEQPVPAAPATPTANAPQGSILSPAPWGRFAVEWAALNRWDGEIAAAAAEHGVDPARIKAHVVIESQGVPDAHQVNPGGDGWGLMQIVPFGVGWEGWHRLVARLAAVPAGHMGRIIAALKDPATNLRVGAAILRGLYDAHGDWDRASSAFFLGNPDWQGQDNVNGTTGMAYKRSLDALMAAIEAETARETSRRGDEESRKGGAEQRLTSLSPLERSDPPLPPSPSRWGDVVAAIVGGMPTNTDFGFKAPTDLPYYEYFEGHGGHANQHTGIDATTAIAQPLYAPIAGTIVCSGSAEGPGAWHTGCAGFADTLGHGAGRVEILAEDGRRSLILGHCSRALAPAGQGVNAGDPVAEAGGMNGPHVHIEARVWDGHDYTIVDPRSAFADSSAPTYAPRAPIPQPSEQEPFILVTATRDGVKVLQRADPTSPEVRAPLRQGEVFEAQYLLYGVDRRWYWVSTLSSRVPVEGTESAELTLIRAPVAP